MSRGLFIYNGTTKISLDYSSSFLTAKTDLGSPEYYKLLNYLDIEYIGAASIAIIGDGESIKRWDLLNKESKGIERLYCNIDNRKVWKNMAIEINNSTENFKVFNIIIDVDIDRVL